MTDLDNSISRYWIIAGTGMGLIIGLVIGLNIGCHKSPSHRKPSVEHCIRIGIGQDYRDIECPSGTYRLYGDTLRVRLHT